MERHHWFLLAHSAIRTLGAARGMGIHCGLVAAGSQVDEPAVALLDLGHATNLYGVHHPSAGAGGVSLLLHAWVSPALVKFGATGTLAIVCTWLLADPLVRLPGLRRVL